MAAMVPFYFITQMRNKTKEVTFGVMERSRAHKIAHLFVKRETMSGHSNVYSIVALGADHYHTFEHNALRKINLR
jgi:hypothetical protein